MNSLCNLEGMDKGKKYKHWEDACTRVIKGFGDGRADFLATYDTLQASSLIV